MLRCFDVVNKVNLLWCGDGVGNTTEKCSDFSLTQISEMACRQ